MKTTIYLRLSLLIPFLVWGICLLLFSVTSLSPDTGGLAMRSVTISILFYLFGIIGWFLPYLVLALILLVLSFLMPARTLIKIFALSPLTMAAFIILFVTIVLRGSPDASTLSPELATDAGAFFGSPAWFGIITLVWGYTCVAIGSGVYKFLQALHVVRETPTPVAAAVPELS